MDSVGARRVTKETLRHMAILAGLELTDERLELLLPQLERSFAGFSRFGEIDLGETEPATIFNLMKEE